MQKIKVGLIGMGYISDSHIDAIRRIGSLEIVGVTDINYNLANQKAQKYSIPKCYRTVDELLSDDKIISVHNCTPNNLHFEINKKVIESGKHIFSEKPLTMESSQSRELINLLKAKPKIVAAVNFLYRMNPLVQEMRQKVKNGDIGKPILVHGSYLQDWLLYDTDYNWRVEKELGGASRAIADIGSHWIDSVQTVLNDRITKVCADLSTIYEIRKRQKGQVETFSLAKDGEYEERKVDTEDYGAVLFKMESSMNGVFYVSQVSAGRKCYLNFEIDGTKSSMYWNQESADWMWAGFRDKYNEQVMRNPNLIPEGAGKFTSLASGHPEGWNDAQRNNIKSFYDFIISTEKKEPDFATFKDAYYIQKVVEAIIESYNTKKWVKVLS